MQDSFVRIFVIFLLCIIGILNIYIFNEVVQTKDTFTNYDENECVADESCEPKADDSCGTKSDDSCVPQIEDSCVKEEPKKVLPPIHEEECAVHSSEPHEPLSVPYLGHFGEPEVTKAPTAYSIDSIKRDQSVMLPNLPVGWDK